MRIALRALLLALPVSFACVPIHAAVLVAPISGQFPDVFGSYCSTGCTQLAYTSSTETDTTATFTATLNAAVYTDPSNTFCAGCLDFVFQISNSANSTDGIGRVTAFDFAGFSVDAGYSTTAPGSGGGTTFATGTDAPGLFDRVTSDTVGFQFASSPTAAIAPGQTSYILLIETNATHYTTGIVSAEDGGTATFAAFEPTAAVPEPASALMLGLGMVLFGTIRRPRRG